MCLAVPAKVIEKKDMVATVEVEGIRRDISLMLLPEANEGDYILMHAGFAIPFDLSALRSSALYD